MTDESLIGGAKASEGDQQHTRRRALLLGAGVVAAGAGATVVSASPASATNPPVLLGTDNPSTTMTSITASSGVAFKGVVTASGSTAVLGFDQGASGGTGVAGVSTNGFGVTGASSNVTGVLGTTVSPSGGFAGVSGEDASTGDALNYGVLGSSTNGIGVYGTSTKNFGVEGVTYAQFYAGTFGTDLSTAGAMGARGDSLHGYGVVGNAYGGTAAGVQGNNTGPGIGVDGVSISGPGVRGTATATGGNGVLGIGTGGADALRATGTSTLDGNVYLEAKVFAHERSGKLHIPAGSRTVTKTGVDLTSASLVFTTIQGSISGAAVSNVDITVGASGRFTIHLLGPAPSGGVNVAWLIIN